MASISKLNVVAAKPSSVRNGEGIRYSNFKALLSVVQEAKREIEQASHARAGQDECASGIDNESQEQDETWEDAPEFHEGRAAA